MFYIHVSFLFYLFSNLVGTTVYEHIFKTYRGPSIVLLYFVDVGGERVVLK